MSSSIDSDALSDREREILGLLAAGKSNREIAESLHLALTTVKWYNTNIYSKLGVSDRQEAIDRARAAGLLEPRRPAADAPRANLPNQITPFVGREDALRELANLVLDVDTAVITILGPGGMGKTRLAIEVAARHSDRFTQGVFFVPLAPLDKVEGILPAIAEHIHYALQKDQRDPEQQLLEHLENRSMLLILDNFEHLLEGAALVNRIVTSAPGVKVLVTSRERLNLSGETVYTLSGMHLPNRQSVDTTLNSDAARLFLQSARRTRPDLTIDAAERADLARICWLTQGMPLALELAAGWVDMLTLGQIADEIQRGIDILETELQDVPQRHRSIRATMDYSWKGLGVAEGAAFIKLSVFRGGFDAGAAEAIAGANLRVLRKLVNKALIYALPDGTYQVHELLRQYGEQRLHAADLYDATRAAHAAHYVQQLANLRGSVWDMGQNARRAIDRDFENITLAWNTIVIQRDFDALRMAIEPLWAYLSLFGRNYEGVSLFEWTRDQFQDLPLTEENRYIRAHVLYCLAELALSINPEVGYDLLDEGIAILEPLGPSQLLVWLYRLHGNLYYENDIINENIAEDWTKRAMELAEQLGLVREKIGLLQMLGTAAMWRQDYDVARQYAQEALQMAEACGCSEREIREIQSLLGSISYYNGDLDEARERVRLLLDVVEESAHLYSISGLRIRLWQIALRQGQPDEAREHVRQMLRAHITHGYDWQVLGSMYGIAHHWYLSIGAQERAVGLLTYVYRQPLTSRLARQDIEGLLNTLRADMEAATYARAQEQLVGQSLDDVIAGVFADLEATNGSSSSDAAAE